MSGLRSGDITSLDVAVSLSQSLLPGAVSLVTLTTVTVTLIIAGMAVMGYSAVRTRRLLRALEHRRVQSTWRLLFGLMLFFLLGYLGAAALVSVGDTTAVLPITGAVFFSGALFVLLVVRVSHLSIDELSETTSFLDDVLDSMGEALLVVSHDGIIERVNPAAIELFGHPHAELIGLAVDDLFTAEARPFATVDEPLERNGEATVVTASGDSVPVLFSASRLAVDADSGRGVVCVVRDITSRKRHELELKRQNSRLEEFASVVSHDLRNPLSVAQGYLDLARETESEQHFERVERALDRIDRLIRGLLELARQGRMVGETEAVPLEEVAVMAWGTVDPAEATLATPSDLGTVQADSERLRQAFENLFTNAVEHGGPRVTVTVGHLPDETGFFVADDGQGVPADDRESVFAHGFSTTKDGTGFGLAIVRTVFEAHGWEVSLGESEAGGARFEIWTDPPHATLTEPAAAAASDTPS